MPAFIRPRGCSPAPQFRNFAPTGGEDAHLFVDLRAQLRNASRFLPTTTYRFPVAWGPESARAARRARGPSGR